LREKAWGVAHVLVVDGDGAIGVERILRSGAETTAVPVERLAVGNLVPLAEVRREVDRGRGVLLGLGFVKEERRKQMKDRIS
jgi:hypothetical protein